MIDFELDQDVDIQFDSNGDYKTVDTIETAILCGLFYEKRDNDRRGFFGFGTGEGSRLWTKEQARVTTDTLNDTRLYANEGLNFLIIDKLVKSVDNEASVGDNGIILNTTITTSEDITINKVFEL
jgi:phage gp46-like protein